NGRAEKVNDLDTPEDASRTYKGATIGINHREGRLKAKGSYTLSSLVGNVFDGITNPWGDVAPLDVFQYGPLSDDHRHEIKVQSPYAFTPWLSAGFRYRYFSGTPVSRLYLNVVDNSYSANRASVGINPGTDINDKNDDREARLPD